MLTPDFNEFKKKSKEGNLIPVYREILADLDTPLSAFLKLKGKRCFLLESVEGGEKWARYSFIGSNPSIIIEGKGNSLTIKRGPKEEKIRIGNGGTSQFRDPLDVISAELKKYKPVIIPGLPRFFGGFLGYIGYDTVRYFEKLPDNDHPGLNLPDIFLMLTDTLVVFDNLTHKIKVISNAYIEESPKKAYEKAEKKIDGIVKKLRSKFVVPGRGASPRKGAVSGKVKFTSNFSKKDFLKAVEKTKDYVKAGDVIQTVISQNFQCETDIPPINAYRALRVINPSPYMYYLETGKSTIVGSSPEILVRVEGDSIELRPIAGTRKRGKTPEEDRFYEEELKADPKEIAEHIMLVDLGRNDTGRVAETGTVEVTELMTVERYSHVMHLASNVVGKLGKKHNAFDVLRASFPAGTVTGAPKIRAMEIIEELEPTKRGPYAGSVGYFDFSGNMDMCITIRTIIFKNKKAYIQAGAGIVADSDPEKEFKETVNKAKAMFKAIEMAEKEL
ncbi:MAG TPA: anthranilate synthase component I [Nitrospirae bacterium]|nr:anthranilate synthase component 1 [bacterium BMS3Abin06]HDH11436.1 anthranilate synthase component I [Nitrospirota bacterium]HDL21219.1 anthranilate synthase component I [Nitrospirota bacterium]HDZ01410.1 anthranilate synthase component I [Nitrospirota bacterium]